jgi:hypothetical protein
MATVNFSVPDDVKHEFDRTFAGENKSALIAGLMREAVGTAGALTGACGPWKVSSDFAGGIVHLRETQVH